jgi:putative FmdB family regulatory protein
MTYEYVCTNCGHSWEAEQSISSPPLKTCPSCHVDAAKRQVSGGAGFILKGGGWYADGYGSKKPEKSGGSKDTKETKADDKKAPAGDGGSAAAKTDSPKTETAKSETPATPSGPAKPT